ncbi:transglycosylase SLT domain-containing protein [Kushneria konosiri]|uniref:Lytic murein transglycosylase n=1 Tax=Kushneria konosiri TaxID=698828 RepID=A0A2Z2H8A2_9GAMM|nr:transglycosylase SLT domain-containing protein [Kushneria konosiri]ARS53703.1 lytic murein transglycosylase [Kushneria konosiri]
MGILLTAGIAAPAMASDESFQQAFEAARAQQWSRIDHDAIQGHVLEGYVEYHELKSRLPGVSPAVINDYLQRYRHSVLSEWMRGVAQDTWGARQQFDNFLAVSDDVPQGTTRQCWYYRALLDREPQRAAIGGRQLWLVDHSQPTACDPLFERLRANGAIDGADIWSRLMLSWRAGEDAMARYLPDELPESWQPQRSAFQRLQNDPGRITELPGLIGQDSPGAPSLYSAAMARLIRQDTAQALAAWREIKSRAPLTDEQRHDIEHDLAFYSLVRDINANAGWADAATAQLGDQDLIELRTRKALEHRQWGEVAAWIERMKPDERRDAHWQYWLGRAREQLGNTDGAHQAWQIAAGQRSFFGFAAADRINQPYALENERITIAEKDMKDAANLPSMRRIAALYRIGEPGLARAEWYYLMRHLPKAQRPTLTQYALGQGWYDLTIYAAIRGDHWDALDWRFPQGYVDLFQKWGHQRNVDPWLLMALARRESSFNPQAQSPVGARGLMQIMPGTGQHVSQQLGVPWQGVTSLEDPETNVMLGSAYIRDMAARYSGNRVAAAAAYNAGPGRVDRWLADSDEPFDLFIEEIPFRETREYVQAVLTYRAIFEGLARGTTQGVHMMTEHERKARYNGALQR